MRRRFRVDTLTDLTGRCMPKPPPALRRDSVVCAPEDGDLVVLLESVLLRLSVRVASPS